MHQQAKFNRTSSSIGRFILLFSLAAGGIAIAIKTLAVAQPTPPAPVSPSVAPPTPPLAAPPAPAPPPAAAPAYSSNFSGTVKRYLLNPEGQVDGLLLINGLQVKFPPDMAKSLSAAVKPGNNVTVTGVPGLSTNFGREVPAYSVTNTQTRQTVVDQPPLYPPQPPTSRYENLSVEGTAQTWLVGGRGELKLKDLVAVIRLGKFWKLRP